VCDGQVGSGPGAGGDGGSISAWQALDDETVAGIAHDQGRIEERVAYFALVNTGTGVREAARTVGVSY
jgi:hypothetical protein